MLREGGRPPAGCARPREPPASARRPRARRALGKRETEWSAPAIPPRPGGPGPDTKAGHGPRPPHGPRKQPRTCYLSLEALAGAEGQGQRREGERESKEQGHTTQQPLSLSLSFPPSLAPRANRDLRSLTRPCADRDLGSARRQLALLYDSRRSYTYHSLDIPSLPAPLAISDRNVLIYKLRSEIDPAPPRALATTI